MSDDADVIDDVFAVIEDRKENRPEGSYTTSLFTHEKGENAVLEKLGEETTELILAAKDDDRVATLSVLDVTVDRNAFGRQKDSFEAPLEVTGFDEPFPAVFIRAPVIDYVGPDVEVLASWDDRPVAIRDGHVVGTAFHPELTEDPRIHDLAFFDSVES